METVLESAQLLEREMHAVYSGSEVRSWSWLISKANCVGSPRRHERAATFTMESASLNAECEYPTEESDGRESVWLLNRIGLEILQLSWTAFECGYAVSPRAVDGLAADCNCTV